VIESACKIAVAIYLRGDDLDPSHVSTALGLEPSHSQFKGEKRSTSTNKEFTTQIGLWALKFEAESNDLPALLEKLVLKVEGKNIVFTEIAGVQEAYVDVFMAVDTDDDGGGDCVFQLSERNTRTLAKLGLPVHFTVAVVRK
jgi:hypothetical protein